MPFLSQKNFMLTNKKHIKNIFTAVMLFVDTKSKNRNFRLSRKRHEKCRKTPKNEKRNWLWKTRQKSTVSIMLRNHFFADFFCYWGFVIHSQFLFSNFDEERVANAKNEKCNWLWKTFFVFSKEFCVGIFSIQQLSSHCYQNPENIFDCKYACKSEVRLKMRFSR